jgi:two-component system, chemotaxis family, response regulator Rcp1
MTNISCAVPPALKIMSTDKTEKIVGRPMEILLVEDDLGDAGITIEALRASEVPCRVSLVRDGDEALEFLHRRGIFRRTPRPDVILLDLHLPKRSGREVLSEVKAREELRAIPVVVLTASATHQDILETEGLNVENYLTKPIDLRQFYAVIKSLRNFMLSDVIMPQ